MPLLSLLMPVKDGAAFIEAAVRSVQAQAFRDWELIVVDDHSTDATARLLRSVAGSDGRVRPAVNPGRGQVQAINHGYGLSRGEFLKVMDSDDLLPPAFSDAFGGPLRAPAVYHDAFLLDGAGGRLARLNIGRRFERLSLEQSLRRIMVSPPRWSWTLARPVAERVFPLPADLPSPHEDVFFGLMIKKSAPVRYLAEPLYVYRQHAGQFYGGLFNFSAEAVRRRAGAMLGVIDLVERSAIVGDVANPSELLESSRAYFSLLSRERVSWQDLARSGLGISALARAAVLRKAPRAASWLSRRRAVRKAGRAAAEASR